MTVGRLVSPDRRRRPLPAAATAAVRWPQLNESMPARGQGTLVAIAFPAAAAVAVALRLNLQGVGIHTGIPAAVVLVALTALAKPIDVAVTRRTSVSTAGAFLVAAALAGGP